MRRWILASASPRRKELLHQMGLEFDIIPATGADEYTGDAASEFDTLDPLYNAS